MNKLADWTNTWFIRPSTCERPSANVEHIWVYMALVSVMGPKMSDAHLRLVHSYFTYLLLECDPRTIDYIQDPKPVDTTDPESNTISIDLKRTYKRLLDFTHPYDAAPKWNLLMAFSRLNPRVLSKTVTDKLSDQLARLTIALALVGRPVLPDTLIFVKSCLGLFQRSLDYKVNPSLPSEFYATTPMFYMSWLRNAIDQAFSIGTMTTQKILDTISYMAWFAGLVRARRSLLAGSFSGPESFEVVDSILKEQIDDLNKVLDEAPMKIESHPPHSHLLDVFGVKPKKKVK